MNRRAFIGKALVSTTLLAGSGVLIPSCERNFRTELMNPEPAGRSVLPDPDSHRILYYASLAPSGHNSQPWFVKITGPGRWIIGSDRTRWLPQVDSQNTETLLSLGAFVENLVQASNALGYDVQVSVIAKDRFDADVIHVALFPSGSRKDAAPLVRMAGRRTVKSRFLSKELTSIDVRDFEKETEGHLFYFPVGTSHCDCMAEAAVEHFMIQFDNEKTIAESAFWTRLKDSEVRAKRDGLTPDGMEIAGFAGFYVRHFMDQKAVTGKAFKEKGIEKVRRQALEGAGWMVVTGDGNTVADLVETGRRFQRMALRAREKMIAIHPMTQTLEEDAGRKVIQAHHSPELNPLFMLRVGYLDQYPDPVSLRRPVEWFVRA